MLDASTIPNTQQQSNLEDVSFFMHFRWITVVPFQNNFWRVIKWVTGISTIEKASGSKNTYQYQAHPVNVVNMVTLQVNYKTMYQLNQEKNPLVFSVVPHWILSYSE